MSNVKLYMLLLGSRPPGRHVEQHDFFFGVGESLKDLIPEIKAFWPEARGKIHIDAWREVRYVDGHYITVQSRDDEANESTMKLFFINLGGYQEGKFEEQHYTLLSVKENRAAAFSDAKKTLFFKTNHFKGASSHIDDKYGIDVDDLYEIDEILMPSQKDRYKIVLTPTAEVMEGDKIHLGYFRLDKL